MGVVERSLSSMRYWFDTEFIEDGRTIDFISIGIVAEDGREYYAINRECDFEKANDWVKENVISQLPASNHPAWKTKDNVAFEVMAFLKQEDDFELYHHTFESLKNIEVSENPEIWAYYADYDWVVFCQLFGTMMDLPSCFPMYCRDIKQECDRLGNPSLPEQETSEHNAIADARWNKRAWQFLKEYELKNTAIALNEQQAIALKNFISDNSHRSIDEDIASIFDELQQKVGW